MEKVLEDTLNALVEENSHLAAQNRLLQEKRDEAIEKAKARKARHRGKYFTQVIHGTCQKLIHDRTLTSTEQAFVFCLLPFLQYKTNFVVTESKILMNTNQIAALTGFSSRYTRDIIGRLETKGIIQRIKYGRQIGVILEAKYFTNGGL